MNRLLTQPARLRQRLIVEDLQSDSSFAPHRETAALAGLRAIQSTPVTGRGGKLLGVLSTYCRNPGRPSEQALRVIDLYARQAAEFIERTQIEASVEEMKRR